MIKTGIVGLGKMGLSHCAIINANPNAQLSAICDSSTFILDAFRKYSNVHCYADYREMLEKENLDSIFIATPTKFHYNIVMDSLEKNLHVFCEKPLSLHYSESLKMSETAGKLNRVNQVGYHNRFLGSFNELKRLLETGVLGSIYHFSGESYGPVVVKEKTGNWRSSKNEGGGCLFDYASHVINLIQYVIGTPQKVSGSLLKNVFSQEVEDAVYASLFLGNGITGQISVNWSDETFRKMSTTLTVLGSKGKIVCDATEVKIYLNYQNSKEKLDKGWNIKYLTELTPGVDFYLRGEEYSSQIDYFFNCILDNTTPNRNSFHDAYHTDRVIDLIFNDAKTN
jgi:predicted dehydrogenase